MGNSTSSGHSSKYQGSYVSHGRHQGSYQQGGGGAAPAHVGSASTRWRAIADNYTSIEQVQDALRREGLESSNLIVAVDFTKSNEWTGKHSFGGRSLHAVGQGLNPYEKAIAIIGRTLSEFDADNLIPCYGFGDALTQDRSVFAFNDGDVPCYGLDAVLARYRQIAPHVRLAGPTSFAPAVYQALRVVAASEGQYHILLLIADGQVTRSSDLPDHVLSAQEQATVDAIVAASRYALSIVMVGVGDGPWDQMREFDDALPDRAFDNFQFVELTALERQFGSAPPGRMEAAFALRALMEIPEQYRTIQRLGLLGKAPQQPVRAAPPLPPPLPAAIASAQPPGALAGQQQPAMQQSYPAAGFMAANGASPGGSAYPAPMHGEGGFMGMPPAAAAPVSFPSGGSMQPALMPHASAPPAPAHPAQSAHMAGPLTAGRLQLGSSMTGRTSPAVSAQQEQVNQMLICPITQEVMDDPVMAADGYTYEREAIAGWLRTHDTSPMTNEQLPHNMLTPNHALRSAIMEAKQRGGAAAR